MFLIIYTIHLSRALGVDEVTCSNDIEYLDEVARKGLRWTVIAILLYIVERAIIVPQLSEDLSTYCYLELYGFGNWLPKARKFNEDTIIAVKYEEEIKISLPIISNLTNYYITVPFKFTNYTLDRLAHKIDTVRLNSISPTGILDLDFSEENQ